MPKHHIQKLLEKQMTRKEFLRNIGFMILALFGVTKFIEQLMKGDFTQPPQKVSTTTRWGGGKFGV